MTGDLRALLGRHEAPAASGSVTSVGDGESDNRDSEEQGVGKLHGGASESSADQASSMPAAAG
jgi:hypothetical protein